MVILTDFSRNYNAGYKSNAPGGQALGEGSLRRSFGPYRRLPYRNQPDYDIF
jgi:hypothetical protein